MVPALKLQLSGEVLLMSFYSVLFFKSMPAMFAEQNGTPWHQVMKENNPKVDVSFKVSICLLFLKVLGNNSAVFGSLCKIIASEWLETP